MKKRLWGLGIAAVMLSGIVLTACGGNGSGSGSNASASAGPTNAAAGQDSGKKSTITFWAAATTPERDTFWQGVAKDFMAKNPNITINYLGVPGDLTGYIQKVNVAIAAGEGPDVINNFTSDFIVDNIEWIQKYLFSYYAVYAIVLPIVLIIADYCCYY
ncbi:MULTISPECIES: extracellular solute-binding protein [unclassified Paenibacillus]|uniref:extracellular solute-binding protein n=1 Tax=unclassified Paenibacillus TaxID=185978 RepID=UPI0027D90894|nr:MULTISPECIES: extracellular solute-binding protein [unclassified Paenibacillus]